MTIEQLTIFLGWNLLINLILFALASLGILLFRERIAAIHSKLMGVQESHLPEMYFKYLGNYKIAIIVLALAPYLAVRLGF